MARFNPPPGWPTPPEGWSPPPGWSPQPSWPPAPAGWLFWIADDQEAVSASPGPDPAAAAQVEQAEVPAAYRRVPSMAVTSAQDPEQPRPSEPVSELHETIAALRAEEAELRETVLRAREAVADRLVELDDQVALQEVGIYRYHHPLEDAAAYRDRLASIDERIKVLVKEGRAVQVSTMFSYNNSLAQGRRMSTDLSKLVLRAYNAEADNALRSLRAGNLATAVQRVNASVTTIERLGAMMELRIAPEYHALRVEELELQADYLMKVQEERERLREERERLREERKAAEELERERERLDKERAHYQNAVQSLIDQGKAGEAEALQQRLVEIDAAIAQNDYRVANIRAGYVYVISNVGAFGGRVVKIGMTRRLDPEDRIRELGDASVPFPFDVHAIYFADDAVQLEGQLHEAFASRRLNHVNPRREFFFATPQEVREILTAKVGNLLEYADEPEATQYFQSRGLWPRSSDASEAVPS
jgi:hypothetical protein